MLTIMVGKILPEAGDSKKISVKVIAFPETFNDVYNQLLILAGSVKRHWITG